MEMLNLPLLSEEHPIMPLTINLPISDDLLHLLQTERLMQVTDYLPPKHQKRTYKTSIKNRNTDDQAM